MRISNQMVDSNHEHLSTVLHLNLESAYAN